MKSPPNFHGHIALPLEITARTYFEDQCIPIAVTADSIETGSFVSVMALLLYIKHGSDIEVLQFLQKTSSMLGLSAHELSVEKAKQVYQDFEHLFNRVSKS